MTISPAEGRWATCRWKSTKGGKCFPPYGIIHLETYKYNSWANTEEDFLPEPVRALSWHFVGQWAVLQGKEHFQITTGFVPLQVGDKLPESIDP